MRLNPLVLVVGEVPAGCKTASSMLAALEYDVMEAETGAEALEKVKAASPDLILLTLPLLDMAAGEFRRRLKANPASSHAPVLFISDTYAGTDPAAMGVVPGIDACLTKPVEPVVLDGVLHLLLRARVDASDGMSKQEAVEKLRCFVDANVVGVVIATPDGGVVDANDYYLRAIGYTREEFERGLVDWRGITPPEWLPVDEHAIEALRQKGACPPYEKEYVRRDGTRVSVFLSIAMIPGPGEQIAAFVLDITERKKAEAALRRNEHVLRLFVEHAPAGIAMFDRNMTYMAASRRFLADYGLGDQDILGRSHYDVFPEISERVKEIHRHCLAGNTAKAEEDRFLRSDGAVEWVRWEIHPWYEIRGEIGGIILFSEVITQRKLAEEELRESESRYRELFESNPHPMWIYDTGTLAFLAVNSAAVAHYGYAREEFLAMTIRDIRPSEDLPKLMANISGLHGGVDHAGIWRHRKRDGALIDVEITSHTLQYDGRPAELVLAHDVTARRESDLERERLMAAIEQACDIILITDPDGAIRYVNPAFETMTGYSREETLGKNPRFLKSGEHGEAFYRDLWGTISRGEVWRGRIVNRNKDGKQSVEAATISPICDSSGRVVNYVAVKRDMTEQLHLEAQFQQAQKMESVGRLAGGVAHDFNNILGVILGYAELAMGKAGEDSKIYSYLMEICAAAQRSSEIIRQLLAFARKQTITPRVLDLNRVVQGMLKMLRRLIGEELDLVWRPGEGAWPVLMDPAQIDQILANLCVNARDAIEGVGRIEIFTENIHIDEKFCTLHPGALPGTYVLLSVADNGTGMDPETLSHIFEPFFTTKGEGKGTGLGLATVYGIVKQNNGFIDAVSEPGKGAAFRIYLPRHTAFTREADEEDMGEIPPGKGETVLLVEDEAAIRKMVKAILEAIGYHVIEVPWPNEAICLAEGEGDIHLLLTDVIMPEMNGRALSEAIGRIRPGLRTLFMSGYSVDVLAPREGDEHMHFIKKPFTKRALALKIREILDMKAGNGVL